MRSATPCTTRTREGGGNMLLHPNVCLSLSRVCWYVYEQQLFSTCIWEFCRIFCVGMCYFFLFFFFLRAAIDTKTLSCIKVHPRCKGNVCVCAPVNIISMILTRERGSAFRGMIKIPQVKGWEQKKKESCESRANYARDIHPWQIPAIFIQDLLVEGEIMRETPYHCVKERELVRSFFSFSRERKYNMR